MALIVGSVAGPALGAAAALISRRWSASFGFGPAIAAGALLVILVPPGSLLFP
jgi:hypothetical protein